MDHFLFFCRLEIKQIGAGISRSNLNLADPKAIFTCRFLAVRLPDTNFYGSIWLNI